MAPGNIAEELEGVGISSSDMSLGSELLSSSILTIPFPSLSESPVIKWSVVLCEGAFAYLFLLNRNGVKIARCLLSDRGVRM